MSTPETGALVTDWTDEIRKARTELRLAVETEAGDRMDDIIRRIARQRDFARPGFMRDDWDALLDRALESRRRFFPEGRE